MKHVSENMWVEYCYKRDLKMKSFRFDWTALMCAQQIQSWIGTGIRYKAVEDKMREK